MLRFRRNPYKRTILPPLTSHPSPLTSLKSIAQKWAFVHIRGVCCAFNTYFLCHATKNE